MSDYLNSRAWLNSDIAANRSKMLVVVCTKCAEAEDKLIEACIDCWRPCQSRIFQSSCKKCPFGPSSVDYGVFALEIEDHRNGKRIKSQAGELIHVVDMDRPDGDKFPSLRKDSDNRFMALEETEMLLKSNHVRLETLFDVLSKSNDGCLDFNFGDIVIQFVHGFGVWSERRDVIQITAEMQAGCQRGDSEVTGYEYTLEELRRLYSQRSRKTDSGEEK